MKLAILFWFYKELEVCKNRLEILRQHNPKTLIYGLHGGKPEEAGEFELMLAPYRNDFYVFTKDKGSLWKWLQAICY